MGAMQAIEGLLQHLHESSTLKGTEAPHLIRLSCHEVLARAGDARAPKLLAHAQAELLIVALTITDPELRHSFLNNIPEHQAIMAAGVEGTGSRR